jgi:nucleotide-binding universal stress UspA family protein
MGRIVCGVDASDGSACAAAVAAGLNRDLALDSVLVHVEPPATRGVTSIAHARERGRMRGLVQSHNVPIGTAVRLTTGRPAPELVRAAAVLDAELVVLGARGSAGPGLPLGRVAAPVTRLAPCPVVLVPQNGHPPYPVEGPRSILCAVQESTREPDLLRLAADLAARLGADLHLVHAFHAGPGNAAEGVVARAAELCTDLIVVAAEGGRPDSVGRLVAAAAPCPVVVLPPDARLAAGSGHYELGARAA